MRRRGGDRGDVEGNAEVGNGDGDGKRTGRARATLHAKASGQWMDGQHG